MLKLCANKASFIRLVLYSVDMTFHPALKANYLLAQCSFVVRNEEISTFAKNVLRCRGHEAVRKAMNCSCETRVFVWKNRNRVQGSM